MVGKPVIKGTRPTVEFVLNLLARGSTFENILNEYEGLTQEDYRPACSLLCNRCPARRSCRWLRRRRKCVFSSASKIEAIEKLLDGYEDRLADTFVVVTEAQVRFAQT